MGKRNYNSKVVFSGLDQMRQRNKLVEICNNAGIDKHITFHKLRHTFAVHMLEKTNNLMLLKELMHHDKIESTLVYANVVDTTKRNELDKFTLDVLGV